MVTRRIFVHALAGSALAVLGRPLLGQGMPEAAVTLTVLPGHRLATVPEDFSGLSYEAGQLAHPDFFAPHNEVLVAYFRRLAGRGVLRIGGNSSDRTAWSGNAAEGGARSGAGAAVGPSGRPHRGGPRHFAPITRAAIRNLAGFLEATDWQLIHGLNLGTGTPQQAAQEAKAVHELVGRRLIAFQIGNEPDLFHRGRRWDLRAAGWNFAAYLTQWREFARAVRAAVPGARLGAPDVANLEATPWVEQFGARAAGEAVFLSHHYYAEGPPEDPRMTIARLLERDPRLLAYTPRIVGASRQARLPFRMTEGNSCYNGGKAGVSDTFASALWAADYMLLLAARGYAGVNFHGGGGGAGNYTPIANARDGAITARPIYYGLLLGQQFAGATMVETRLEAGETNLVAYAATHGSGLRIALINKDERRAARVTLRAGMRPGRARAWRLAAPRLDSTTGARLAGAAVSAAGHWAPEREEHLASAEGRSSIFVPAASAALVFLG